MLSRITTAFNNNSLVSETAQTFSKTISNYPTIYDNYNKLSDKVSENYSTFSSSLNDTKTSITSTFHTSTDYIYSLPRSIEDQLYSYTTMLQPVNDFEERDIGTSPNEHLGDGVIPLDSEREEIVNHILALYGCKPSKDCFKHYDDSVTFEDPFTLASGLPNMKSQFYGMPKLFARSTTDSYKILQNNANLLVIDLNQRYVLPYVNRAIVQNSEISLEFTADAENKKIIKHTDRWNGKPLGRGEMLRKGTAKIVSALVWIPED